jgi:hypothetical protein
VPSSEVISHYETFNISREPKSMNMFYVKMLKEIGVNVPPTWVSSWLYELIFQPSKYSLKEFPSMDIEARVDYFSINRLVDVLEREIKYKKMKLYDNKFEMGKWCKKRTKSYEYFNKMFPDRDIKTGEVV